MDCHLYQSTTTKKAWCQRYKATSLLESTHSSFVFFQCSLCIMFHMLFSAALQMWNFKCRVFKNNKEKKNTTLKITELCKGTACGSLKSSVYREFRWFMYCWLELSGWQEGGGQRGRKLNINTGKYLKTGSPGSCSCSAETREVELGGGQDLPLLEDLAVREGPCGHMQIGAMEGELKSIKYLLHYRTVCQSSSKFYKMVKFAFTSPVEAEGCHPAPPFQDQGTQSPSSQA